MEHEEEKSIIINSNQRARVAAGNVSGLPCITSEGLPGRVHAYKAVNDDIYLILCSHRIPFKSEIAKKQWTREEAHVNVNACAMNDSRTRDGTISILNARTYGMAAMKWGWKKTRWCRMEDGGERSASERHNGYLYTSVEESTSACVCVCARDRGRARERFQRLITILFNFETKSVRINEDVYSTEIQSRLTFEPASQTSPLASRVNEPISEYQKSRSHF